VSRKESGSAHIIIVTVLAIALIASIGFIFWQNIINKPQDTVTNPIKTVKATVLPQSQSKTYCTPLEKLCFDYPSDWKVGSVKVTPDSDGMMERIVISSASGKPWLRLETGLTGIGGTCGNTDNSYSKILKTHSTTIHGSYLVHDGTEEWWSDRVYAVGWTTYSGSDKDWTIHMNLSSAKAVQQIGKLDPCDIGIGVIDGKNAKADGMSSAGALAFEYYTGTDGDTTYTTEADATAVLTSADAVKAYDILQSAHYEE